ncbi:MAG: hypothetical protein OXR72_20965 [Gemmatimonadota bacterium]|nr:hypothetical protein [Gemmatimonadota bacterium]
MKRQPERPNAPIQKKEEGRRKKEEGRRKKQKRKKEEGRRKKQKRKKEEGKRKKGGLLSQITPSMPDYRSWLDRNKSRKRAR